MMEVVSILREKEKAREVVLNVLACVLLAGAVVLAAVVCGG